MTHKHLIKISYLGYRFHGWAKQPKLKTIHEMVDKTLRFIFKEGDFKTLGASRTDAKVSAHEQAFQLFTNFPIQGNDLLEALNQNFPPDIKALSITPFPDDFNIIHDVNEKTYVYLFSEGLKAHPFCAPILFPFKESLDIALMQEGAKHFEGTHDFRKYCTKPTENTQTVRKVKSSKIIPNGFISASFFPEKTWAFEVVGKGFMRYQIRLMMGQLVKLGKGEISLEEIKETLQNPNSTPLDTIAPPSGLHLKQLLFNHDLISHVS